MILLQKKGEKSGDRVSGLCCWFSVKFGAGQFPRLGLSSPTENVPLLYILVPEPTLLTHSAGSLVGHW